MIEEVFIKKCCCALAYAGFFLLLLWEVGGGVRECDEGLYRKEEVSYSIYSYLLILLWVDRKNTSSSIQMS